LTEAQSLDLSSRPVVSAALPVLAWVASATDQANELFDRARDHHDAWVRATVPLAQAQWAENEGDVPAMRSHYEEAYAAFEAIGDRWGITASLSGMANVAMLDDQLDRAGEAFEQARQLLQTFGAEAENAMLHMRLADVRHRQGRQDEALVHAREALGATDLAGPEAAIIGGGMAQLLWQLGETDESRRILQTALQTVERVGDWGPTRGHVHAMVYSIAAVIDLEDGEPHRARERLAIAYPAGVGTSDLPILAMVATAVARLALHDGKARDAAEILGAAARMRGSADLSNPEVARLRARLTDELGETTFAELFEAGHALDREAGAARVDPTKL
ncbi:MAG: tetratricopeptide repeat protein, partial [Solirubrobacteraceae bacterium]|nr:tetratricopeptide repeat protein [Solirubrobacteraceae bacterium]